MNYWPPTGATDNSGSRAAPARHRWNRRSLDDPYPDRAHPARPTQQVAAYAALMVVSVLIRAVGTVLLVPLIAALFSETPSAAWVWLGWLTVATVVGWVVDTAVARIAFNLGFALLDHTQHDMAERLPTIALGWLTAENTATARQAIAATGPELVGLVVNLLTPLISAILLPFAIALALLFVAWPLGLAALGGVAVLLARWGLRAD